MGSAGAHFAFVLKRELTRIPLFGPMLRADRHDRGRPRMPAPRRSATCCAAASLRRPRGRQIIIFPEGTRVAPGATATLHPGVAALAARTRLPVIPVVDRFRPCWGRREFRKRPGVIRLAIQPPIDRGCPRAELMAQLEAAFARGRADLASPVDNSVGETGAALVTECELGFAIHCWIICAFLRFVAVCSVSRDAGDCPASRGFPPPAGRPISAG